MDTYHFLRTLWQHWTKSDHPVYRRDSQHIKLTPALIIIWRYVMRVWRPLAALGLVVAMLILADFLCGAGRRGPALTSGLTSLLSVIGLSVGLLVVLLLAYLWPLAVAVSASGVIAGEHEHQTWDVLLTTPLDWGGLILAKLAAGLRRLNPYGEILLWVQVFLVAVLFVVILGDFLRDTAIGTALLPQAVLLVAALIEFVIARAQDYVLAALIGVISSLLAPNRQMAATVALMFTVALVLVRALLTVLVLTGLPPNNFAYISILIVTGPASVIAMVWPVLIGIPALLLMVIGRELLIRALYTWLVRHMGDATEASLI